MKKYTCSWSALILSFFVLVLIAFPTRVTAQNIQVISATPNSATQGTIDLNVIVAGSGFKRGARTQWFVTGTTNPGGVTVNSSSFNNSGQLTANITVSDTADLASYDILVTNTDGRSGKGTKLFSVNSKGNSGPSCSIANVTSILTNTDSNNAAFQFQSDGLGPYVAYSSGHGKSTDLVASQIDSGTCAWTLDTVNSSSRGLAVTLDYPDSSGPPAPFTGAQTVKGRINTHCTLNPANNGLDLGSMTDAGQTLTCPINIAFYYNSVWYNVIFGPTYYPASTQVQIMCTGASGGQCNQWSVQPDPSTSVLNTSTNQPSALGELVLPSCGGCIAGTPLGLYEFSFSFIVHR